MLCSRSTTGLLVALAFAAVSTGCGGPAIPKHDGYRSAKSKPWKKPKRVKLDESNEGDIEGTLSYAKKRRARWYMIELPSDGELTLKMDMIPLGDRQNIQPGFEVLDSNFKTLVRIEAPRDDDGELRAGKKKKSDDEDEYEDEYDDDDDDDDYVDESEELLEWSRTLYELRAGKYYLHVWVNGRLDVAEYSMRVKFARAVLEQETDFPAQVAFVSPLPVVPAFDDAPEVDCKTCSCKKDARCKSTCGKCKSSGKPSYCSRCSCSDAKCKSRCTRKCGGGTPAPTGKAVIARITRPVASGSGTKITMNRGSSHGVAVGWKGKVVTSAGKAIDNGSFTVTKVSASESVGTVGASPDAVTSAGRVRLTP